LGIVIFRPKAMPLSVARRRRCLYSHQKGPVKKLTLDLEALCLESFDVDAAPDALGTVHGADSTATDGCPGSYPFHCLPQPSRGCA
jgi:hypothetical protein